MKRPAASWIVVETETRNAVFETFDKSLADRVNKEKYEALEVEDYFDELEIRWKNKKSGIF